MTKSKKVKCYACDGKGTNTHEIYGDYGFSVNKKIIGSKEKPCWACKGSGTLLKPEPEEAG